MGICCMKVTPCLFFFFNHIFFILGALVVGFGIWILMDVAPFSAFLQVSSPSIKWAAYVLIVVGGITLLKGFLGCVSILCGVQCFLGLYIICLLLIMACQIGTGFYVYFQEENFKENLAVAFSNFLQTYAPKNDTREAMEIAVDFVQTNFSCCGWTGPENWLVNKVLQERKWAYYPCSCAGNETLKDFGFCPLTNTSVPHQAKVDDWPVKKEGCKDVVYKWMEGNFDIIFGVSIGLLITEALGMVLALCICKKKRWIC